MLKTQKLFKDLGWVSACEFLKAEPLNIQVKEYENFVVLNYNQIFSPETDDYVMECRSLQLDKGGNVVSRSFPRFFNYGQRPEITGKFKFDKDTLFYAKEDGSLIRVYWNPFDSRWECATRGTAFAESEQDFFPTFREAIIKDGFGLEGEEEFQALCNDIFSPLNTYVFEYCSLKNCIVTPYENPKMVLLAVFDNADGSEAPWDDLNFLYFHGWFDGYPNITLISTYKFDNYEDMKVNLDNLKDLKEGFVAMDSTGLRVKFKNDLYLKLHKMRGDLGFTPKKIAAVVGEGEEEEVLTYFGQYRHLFAPIIRARNFVFASIQNHWEMNKDIVEQKEYAMAVKDLKYSAILFSMRNKKQSFQEAWDACREEYKVELILEYNEYLRSIEEKECQK